MDFSQDEFLRLGKSILGTPQTYGVKRDETDFKGAYGVGPLVASIVWHEMEHPPKAKPKHLLWALLFMRQYKTENHIATLCKTTRVTLRKWVWPIIHAISVLGPTFIKWEKRFRNANANAWCRVSVDGTDFRIYEPTPFSRAWYSHKFHGPGVRYEVAVSIGSGDIVWVHGPFPCGSWPDIKIFRNALKHMLDENEMVEADNGYRGEPTKIRLKDDYVHHEECREKSRIRARHETVNRRFKQFAILGERFRHDLKLHGVVFRAIAVLTQVDIDIGNTLFAAWTETPRRQAY